MNFDKGSEFPSMFFACKCHYLKQEKKKMFGDISIVLNIKWSSDVVFSCFPVIAHLVVEVLKHRFYYFIVFLRSGVLLSYETVLCFSYMRQ